MVRSRPSGFTLIELIVTMMIVGILALAAASRFSGTQDFDRRGFYDETLAALRYAQKAAIAQRRNVCVTFTSATVTLNIAADSLPATACNTNNLASPTGAASFVVTARPGVAFAATPSSFQFDALGRSSAFRTIQVAGLSGLSITVEQETGYVH